MMDKTEIETVLEPLTEEPKPKAKERNPRYRGLRPNLKGRPKGAKESREARKEKQDRKIIELRANNVPMPAIAAAVGLSTKTVFNRLKQFDILLKGLDRLDDFERNRGSILAAAQYKTLKSMMDDEKIAKASFNNLAYGFTQLHMAERLERGKSTTNNAVMQFTTPAKIDDYQDPDT